MSACKTLVRTSLSSLEFKLRTNHLNFTSISVQLHFRSISSLSSSSPPPPPRKFLCFLSRNSGFRLDPQRSPSRRCYSQVEGAIPLEATDFIDEPVAKTPFLEPQDDVSKDTVEQLLLNKDDATQLMKMERRPEGVSDARNRWFPYLDKFKAGGTYLSSGEILEAIDPHIMEVRKERFRNVVRNRTYSVCLVIEGLSDFGNVSAALRSADALGFQSVHVVSCDSSKRYRDNRHVSMGAEKWLDIELWNSTQECFNVLKSRGYRIATTHVGIDAVSVYDMDWSCPTAIVVGNESRGISDEALQLSDFHCSIPMKGMVDSFNVSVAAGILMHQAVCDRTSRLGCHGDLTMEESQILLAEFSLRHSKSAISIAHEYAKRKGYPPMPNI